MTYLDLAERKFMRRPSLAPVMVMFGFALGFIGAILIL